MKTKGREMKKGTGEGAAFAFVALLLLACAFAFSHSLESVKWYVNDKDPNSYVGIVLLMVAIQLIFFFAGGLKVEPDLKGAAAGVACFLLAAGVFVVLPQELSLNFWFFRLDLLALALFLVGSIALVFGSETLWRLRALALFSLLACPLLAAPITLLEQNLTALTADAAYSLSSILSLPIERLAGNVFTTPLSDVPIIIVAACAALAAYLSFLAFMIPLAYLMKGDWARRLGWLVCGALLIMLLNLLRIFTVIYIWQSSGLANAATFFQQASGNVLFNLALLAMIVSFPLFGLSLPAIRGAGLLRNAGKAIKEFAGDLKATKKEQLAVVAALLIVAGAFSLLDAKTANYAWLGYYEGKEFSAAQASPAALPYPDSWDFLGSETGFDENYTVTRMAFDENGTQIQASVYSSGDRTTLGFSAEQELVKEGYSIEKVERAALGMGITGKIVTYRKGEMAYSTLYWTQPAQMMGRFTYVAMLFTVADPERNQGAWLKQVGREFVSQFAPS